MQLWFGPYGFPVNGMAIGSRIQNMPNKAQITLKRKVIMSVSGSLLATLGTSFPQQDLTAQTILLTQALSNNYFDLVLRNDDGSLSATILLNAGSLTGVVITEGPDFPGKPGDADYATQRRFSFTAMAEYVNIKAQTALENFSESLDFSGGLPLYVMCRAVNGLPQRQQTYAFTEFCCTQSGSAVGLLAFPTPPGPKFPSCLKEAPRIKRSGPERVGNTFQNYGISWTYVFESVTPMVGAPTLWTQ
jgi:hypothetical protein